MAGPTPQSASTGRGWRKASSSAGQTTTTPRPARFPARVATGLAAREASLATSFDRPTPTEQSSASSSRTRSRTRWAITSGGPSSRRAPVTSRKASSSPIGSTSGVVEVRISRSCPLNSA